MTHRSNSKLLASLFDAKNTLSSLIIQSNKLAKLTGDACLIGENLKSVQFICNSEIMVTAFTQIVKGINPNVITKTVSTSQFIQSKSSQIEREYSCNQVNVDILILTNASDINDIISFKEKSENVKFETPSKFFVIAPTSFHLSSLSKLNANIILSIESSADDIRGAFLHGIKGDELTKGFSSPIDDNCSNLTPRQTEILELLCDGKSNKEISRDLNLAMGTIKTHIIAIFRALDVTNRTQAAMLLKK